MTHICVSELSIIGSDNGLSPGRRQAIIWTNGGILLIRTSGTNFSEILSQVHTFSLKQMPLNMLSGKWPPFCLGLNVFLATARSKIWRSTIFSFKDITIDGIALFWILFCWVYDVYTSMTRSFNSLSISYEIAVWNFTVYVVNSWSFLSYENTCYWNRPEYMTWNLLSSPQVDVKKQVLKQSCHFDEIFCTGCTRSCHFDNFCSGQWWKFQLNDIPISVIIYKSVSHTQTGWNAPPLILVGSCVVPLLIQQLMHPF